MSQNPHLIETGPRKTWKLLKEMSKYVTKPAHAHAHHQVLPERAITVLYLYRRSEGRRQEQKGTLVFKTKKRFAHNSHFLCLSSLELTLNIIFYTIYEVTLEFFSWY